MLIFQGVPDIWANSPIGRIRPQEVCCWNFMYHYLDLHGQKCLEKDTHINQIHGGLMVMYQATK